MHGVLLTHGMLNFAKLESFLANSSAVLVGIRSKAHIQGKPKYFEKGK